jgi:hypothetical protein
LDRPDGIFPFIQWNKTCFLFSSFLDFKLNVPVTRELMDIVDTTPELCARHYITACAAQNKLKSKLTPCGSRSVVTRWWFDQLEHDMAISRSMF